jgi:hypothetical protein
LSAKRTLIEEIDATLYQLMTSSEW